MSAYFITAEELADNGLKNIPKELNSREHLIYSSPATLAFNSPGAAGFGVKRAALAVPGSVMLLVSPACCGRNTTLEKVKQEYAERFFFLLQDETDIVTGRHLSSIPEAVKQIVDELETKPSCVLICITCVDALLGTDMQKVCALASERSGVRVAACYMYALTRENRLPPMASVRRTVYSFLEKTERRSDETNILGFFSPLDDECEIYEYLKRIGIKKAREISRTETFEEYLKMSRANFNLLLDTQAIHAAYDMEKNLGIPYILIRRMFRHEKVANQYRLLFDQLGTFVDDSKEHNEAIEAGENFTKIYGHRTFSVGEWLNADPFEMSLALTELGHSVENIFGMVTEANFAYIKLLAEKSPNTRIYSNLSPTMMFYDNRDCETDICVGRDAGYYHPSVPCAFMNEERQPFGYEGIDKLFRELTNCLREKNEKAF